MDRVTESKVIGVATPRIDGPLKVSGSAKYASDHHFPGLLYAWPVCATISNGPLTPLDTDEAKKMPGVIAVYHRENIGKLYCVPPSTGFTMIIDENVPHLRTIRSVITANMLPSLLQELSSKHEPQPKALR
jgi:xanthine dehydrogenase YagR molybdenum-binding subunit